jgi:hypothetical protein
LVVIPTYAPYNQLLLLPALMLIIRDGLRVWRRGGVSRLFCLIAALTLAWSWIAAALLSGLLVFVSRTRVQGAWALPLLSNFYVPLMVLAMTALCTWPYKRVPKATESE